MKKGGKPIQIISRSLIQPWTRFMVEINFNICPRDTRGIGICRHYYLSLKEQNRQFLQPGFEVGLNIIDYEPGVNTNMHCKFINGFERKFNLACLPWTLIQQEIEIINQQIGFLRALEGQDDEPEDGF